MVGARCQGPTTERSRCGTLRAGARCTPPTGHADEVGAVALSADGRRAVSGSGDKTLKVWDVESGQELATLQGHDGAVMAVALSADGRRAGRRACRAPAYAKRSEE